AIKKIADLDIESDRGLDIDKNILTTNVEEVISNPEVDIVVELIGGIHPAKEIIVGAMERGKHVVTANKALLATEGADIFNIAEKHGVELGFEASVAGGIPIIKVIKEAIAGNRVLNVYGIMNGTANYILTKMTEESVDFSVALKEAQRLGFAEADPSFDIEGIDSAHKITILASLAYSIPLSYEKIFIEGIKHITPLDISYATEFGYKIKLLSVAKYTEDGIELRVHPTMLPKHYLISNVDGVYNAVFIEWDDLGSTLLYGKGAGSLPTGSAVVSDIIDIGRNIRTCSGRRVPLFGSTELKPVKIKDIGDLFSPYYFRFSVVDKPGVLSKISGILGENSISIQSVIQKGRRKGEAVPLVMLTHEAKEKDVKRALKEISSLNVVLDSPTFIRVEG
ncbi:MAG: homoserine dehydrogenase, partial [Nitrospirae bacterium]